MKKYLMHIAFYACICGAAYIAGRIAGEYFFPKTVQVVNKTQFGSIVRLTRDGHTFCTGTVIQENLIVTAAHCVTMETPFGTMLNSEEIEIRPNSNVSTHITARAVYATAQMDQALLAGNFSAFEVRPYITDPASLTKYRVDGTRLVSCGYPLMGNLYCTVLTYKHPDNFYWAVDGVLIPGMSGGPTMINGTVIAVNTAVEGPLAIVSPIYNITSALKERAESKEEKEDK
jgi:V8-like Glu-specific endopeptidase